jgi:hypothetical protein
MECTRSYVFHSFHKDFTKSYLDVLSRRKTFYSKLVWYKINFLFIYSSHKTKSFACQCELFFFCLNIHRRGGGGGAYPPKDETRTKEKTNRRLRPRFILSVLVTCVSRVGCQGRIVGRRRRVPSPK